MVFLTVSLVLGRYETEYKVWLKASLGFYVADFVVTMN